MPSPLAVSWQVPAGDGLHVVFAGDSRLVAKWLSGRYSVKFRCYQEIVGNMQDALFYLTAGQVVGPTTVNDDYWHHQYREYNKCADHLANRAALGSPLQDSEESLWSRRYLWVQMDGSFQTGGCGYAALVWGRADFCSDLLGTKRAGPYSLP